MKRIFLPVLLVCLMVSCGDKREDTENQIDDARELFNQTSRLIMNYTSKIGNAPDSTVVDSLREEFDKKIVDLNFSFPPNTDLKLTEQENDSLFKLATQFRETYDNKLKRLVPAKNDSTANK